MEGDDDANCKHSAWDTRKGTSLLGRRRNHKENNSYPIRENRNLFVVPPCSQPEHRLSWPESCARYVILYLNIDGPSHVIFINNFLKTLYLRRHRKRMYLNNSEERKLLEESMQIKWKCSFGKFLLEFLVLSCSNLRLPLSSLL